MRFVKKNYHHHIATCDTSRKTFQVNLILEQHAQKRVLGNDQKVNITSFQCSRVTGLIFFSLDPFNELGFVSSKKKEKKLTITWNMEYNEEKKGFPRSVNRKNKSTRKEEGRRNTLNRSMAMLTKRQCQMHRLFGRLKCKLFSSFRLDLC